MLPPIFQALKASSDVKAIVGTNPPRIYRSGNAPQADPNKPQQAYITWFLVAGAPENQLSGTPTTDHDIVQVDCWHPSDSGCEALSDAARDALEGICLMTGILVNERDADTKLFRLSLQFDIFNDR